MKWSQAVQEMGAVGLHFHDLRHNGNTFAARTGASLRDLMQRMGHDSPAAALIYQHAGADADKGIAEAVSAAVERESAWHLHEHPAPDIEIQVQEVELRFGMTPARNLKQTKPDS